MTDNRTTELLPCPFCGGEAVKHQAENGMWHIDTMKCCNRDIAHHAYVIADTEAEAIAAWNTRAGRGECEMRRVSNTRDIRECSACGKHFYFSHPHARDNLNFCPNCGKKVKR